MTGLLKTKEWHCQASAIRHPQKTVAIPQCSCNTNKRYFAFSIPLLPQPHSLHCHHIGRQGKALFLGSAVSVQGQNRPSSLIFVNILSTLTFWMHGLTSSLNSSSTILSESKSVSLFVCSVGRFLSRLPVPIAVKQMAFAPQKQD